MHVLFSTGSPASYMLPPSLGDHQVNCGPDWADDTAPDGCVRSFATPAGSYDLAMLAATKLPLAQQPDVVVCLVDASWRNVPRNLGAFKCPKVLLIADTHHLTTPLMGMIRYLAAETFDRVVFLYDRHHAGIFASAGFQNLFWFPGLTFPHSDATVRAARSANREPRIAFVGQTGKIHPRRARLVGALTTRGLPVAAQMLPQREALGFYGSSLLGFNASLNGDFNLRVFEVLATGGALLTDRLAPESGLEEMFTDGVELALYGDSAELCTLAQNLLARPDDARAIGAAGARWFDHEFNEVRRRAAFRDLAFDGKPLAGCELPGAGRTRVFFGGDTDRLLQSVIVYEDVQELHRTQETTTVAIDRNTPDDLIELYSTLPRVTLRRPGDGDADLAIFGQEQAAAVSTAKATRLWCWDAPAAGTTELDSRFAETGFVRESEDVAVYTRGTVRSLAPSPAPKPGGAGGTRAVGRKICITFGGEVYDGPTALTKMLAPKFGADDVWVYDDHWLVHERPDFYEQNRWLWEHHHKRGFGWYAWKPFILLDALDRMNDGDVVLYLDADTFPVDDFSVLYERCASDGGIMLFKAGGNVNRRFQQRQWCKRDCFIAMNQDEEKYYEAEAGVARFMLFQKGPWRAKQFLMEWLTYCVNPIATTFDPSVLAPEVAGFEEHRTEQAIMTNLAHKYRLKLYREACELGNSFPEDKELYPQLFSQMNPWGNKTAPCVGSKFRNVT